MKPLSGQILGARGDSARALQEFETSQAIAQRAAARGLSGPLWQERLLRGYVKVGDARRVLADKPGAVSAYKSGLGAFRAVGILLLGEGRLRDVL